MSFATRDPARELRRVTTRQATRLSTIDRKKGAERLDLLLYFGNF